MFDKLEDILFRYDEVLKELSEPEVLNDAARYQKLMKEQSDLEPIVEKYKEYKEKKAGIEDSLAMLEEETDEELRELAKEELNECKGSIEGIEKELRILLLPKDPNDDKNVIVEIRAGAGGDGDDLRSQQPHPVDVQGLALGVLLPHEHHALHAHQGGGGGGGHAVLPRAGLGDQASLAHLLRQQRLAQHVVDLVGTGVVQVLPFQIDLSAAQVLRDLLCKIQSAGAARVIVQKPGQLRLKLRVVFVILVSRFQLLHGIHQRFGNVLPAVDAKSSFRIRHSDCLLVMRNKKPPLMKHLHQGR